MAEKRTKADGFMLRFPDGMRERLKAAAEANNRSLNNEIIQRLDATDDLDALIADTRLAKREVELLRRTVDLQTQLLDRRQTLLSLTERHGAYAASIAIDLVHAVQAAAKGDTALLDAEVERQRVTPFSTDRLVELLQTLQSLEREASSEESKDPEK